MTPNLELSNLEVDTMWFKMMVSYGHTPAEISRMPCIDSNEADITALVADETNPLSGRPARISKEEIAIWVQKRIEGKTCKTIAGECDYKVSSRYVAQMTYRKAPYPKGKRVMRTKGELMIEKMVNFFGIKGAKK